MMRAFLQPAAGIVLLAAAMAAPAAGCGKRREASRPATDSERSAVPAPRGAARPPARQRPGRRPAVPPRPRSPRFAADLPASTLPAAAQLPADAEARLARQGLLSFPSQWSGKVHVRQRGRVRLLHLGKRLDIVHTRLHMDRPAELISPYQQCVLVGLGLYADPQRELRRVAMIGLGGGALTRFFHIKFPSIAFHSVEIDPVVVAVARRFFGVKDGVGFRSYAMDGRKFMEREVRPYDLIILDAFDAAVNMPRKLASVEFFELLKRRLTPHGVLVTNFLIHSPRMYASVARTMRSVFPATMRLPLRRFASRNTLLIAPADPRGRVDPATLSARVLALGKRLRVTFPVARCLGVVDKDRVDLTRAPLIHDPPPAGGAPPRR
jgi:spermidine synthase